MTIRTTILAGAALAVIAAPCAFAQEPAATPPSDSIVAAPTVGAEAPVAAPAPAAMPEAVAATTTATAPATPQEASAAPAVTEATAAAPKMRGDTDGDGFVSKDEFMAPHEKRFQKIDTNTDGKISPEERQAFDDMMAAKAAEKKAAEPAAETDGKKPSFFSRFFD